MSQALPHPGVSYHLRRLALHLRPSLVLLLLLLLPCRPGNHPASPASTSSTRSSPSLTHSSSQRSPSLMSGLTHGSSQRPSQKHCMLAAATATPRPGSLAATANPRPGLLAVARLHPGSQVAVAACLVAVAPPHPARSSSRCSLAPSLRPGAPCATRPMPAVAVPPSPLIWAAAVDPASLLREMRTGHLLMLAVATGSRGGSRVAVAACLLAVAAARPTK